MVVPYLSLQSDDKRVVLGPIPGLDGTNSIDFIQATMKLFAK